jgi:beta-1,4-mannosyl-glycoprotein beta-1,4-N-acetylglucosaminyltransferase
MRGFSHSDRIGGRTDLLEPKRIQETICRGKDIFGMLPEAYSVSPVAFKLKYGALNAMFISSIWIYSPR